METRMCNNLYCSGIPRIYYFIVRQGVATKSVYEREERQSYPQRINDHNCR